MGAFETVSSVAVAATPVLASVFWTSNPRLAVEEVTVTAASSNRDGAFGTSARDRFSTVKPRVTVSAVRAWWPMRAPDMAPTSTGQ